MKFAQTMTILIAGSVVGAAAMPIQPIHAATLTYDFSVAIDPASSFLPGAQGSGSFSVDDSSFDSLGSAIPTQLDFKFNDSSSLYTAKDDINYPTYPIIFQTASSGNGSPVGLNFVFLYKNSVASAPEKLILTGNDVSVYENAKSGQKIGSGTISYAAAGVPEPSNVGAIVLAGGIGLWLLKRQRSTATNKAPD